MPKGFFDSKEADAAAQGIKLPTAKDKEAEWQQWQKVVEEQMVQVGGQWWWVRLVRLVQPVNRGVDLVAA